MSATNVNVTITDQTIVKCTISNLTQGYIGGAELNTWYVNKNGLNSNDGSPQNPFLTIEKAIDSAQSDDVINIGVGIFSENLSINKNIVIQGSGGRLGSIDNGTYIDGDLEINTTAGNVKIKLFNLFQFATGTGLTETGGNIAYLFLNNAYFHGAPFACDRLYAVNSVVSGSSMNVTTNFIAWNSDILGSVNDPSVSVSLTDCYCSGNLTSTSNITLRTCLIAGNVSCIAKILRQENTVIVGTITAGTHTINNQDDTTKLSKTLTPDQTIASNVEFLGQASANDDTIKLFSATPTFDFDEGNDQEMPVTGNVSAFAVSNVVGSANYSVWLINDATPGRTVAAPTGSTEMASSDTHDTAANAINLYQFKTRPGGTLYHSILNI